MIDKFDTINVNLGGGTVPMRFDGSVLHSDMMDISVLGEDEDGDIVCSHGNTTRYLINNRISDRYMLTDPAKRLPVRIFNFCQVIKCDSLKYICFIISKNGCSCILKSALEYDGIQKIPENSFAWEAVYYDSNGKAPCVHIGYDIKTLLESDKFKDYKKFIILQDEHERFMKFINFSHKKHYNKYVNMTLDKDASFDEHIFLYPYFTKSIFACDQHALSQRAHIMEVIRQVYGGDQDRFMDDVEFVHLDNLKDWFKDAFGKDMLLNNMDSKWDMKYSLESLSKEQHDKLDNLLAPEGIGVFLNECK